MGKLKIFLVIAAVVILISGVFIFKTKNKNSVIQNVSNPAISENYSIDFLRNKSYPGSEITIEQTLPSAPSYKKYIVSYKSEGLKIYALMTVPVGKKPADGWPVIIFNHGYITPSEYSTVSSYAKYVDVLAKNGFIVFKSDYRGNGKSEGTPSGHFGPGYTTDILNAISSVKKLKDPSTGLRLVNVTRIGLWGHSLGGAVTLNSIVISKEIKAASIWAGTVAPISDQLGKWGKRGEPRIQNQAMVRFIDPLNYLSYITSPVEIQQGLSDTEVNPKDSENLYTGLKDLGKTVYYYTYPGDNHSISNNFNLAMQRSVEFFNKYLKGN